MKDHSMTNPRNSTPALYSIQREGQYTAITLSESANQDGTFDGEVQVYSHLGDFSGVFTSCPGHLRHHLADIGMAEFFAKCDGSAHLTFDGAASVTSLGKLILVRRRAGAISADVACEMWSDMQFCRDAAAQSELNFRGLATRLCTLDPGLGRPSELTLKTLSPQAKHFWDTIWPEFKRMFGVDRKPSLQRLAA